MYMYAVELNSKIMLIVMLCFLAIAQLVPAATICQAPYHQCSTTMHPKCPQLEMGCKNQKATRSQHTFNQQIADDKGPKTFQGNCITYQELCCVKTWAHTWVMQTHKCSLYSKKKSQYGCTRAVSKANFKNIGFENVNPENIHGCGQGGLRNEDGVGPDGGTYKCNIWPSQQDTITNSRDSTSRKAVEATIQAGWDTARYCPFSPTTVDFYIGKGFNTCPENWDTVDPDKRSNGYGYNVCWRYICAYIAALNTIVNGNGRSQRDEVVNSTIPSEWTCSNSKYGTNDGCDCMCGAWDPDCYNLSLSAKDCPAPSDICTPDRGCTLRSEVLQERKWTLALPPHLIKTHESSFEAKSFGDYSVQATPANWTCPPHYFSSNDGCDCGCGAHDPDCDQASLVPHQSPNCPLSNDTHIQTCSRMSGGSCHAVHRSTITLVGVSTETFDSDRTRASAVSHGVLIGAIGAGVLVLVVIAVAVGYYKYRSPSSGRSTDVIDNASLLQNNTNDDSMEACKDVAYAQM